MWKESIHVAVVQVRHLCEDGGVESCRVQYTYFQNLAEVFSIHCRYIILMWPNKYAHLLSIPVFVTTVNC